MLNIHNYKITHHQSPPGIMVRVIYVHSIGGTYADFIHIFFIKDGTHIIDPRSNIQFLIKFASTLSNSERRAKIAQELLAFHLLYHFTQLDVDDIFGQLIQWKII